MWQQTQEWPAGAGGAWAEAIGVFRSDRFGEVRDEPTTPPRGLRCQATHRRPATGAPRPCSRFPTARVTGAQRLTVDVCAQHARMAVDRPRLVKEWLLGLATRGDERLDAPGSAAVVPMRPSRDGAADIVVVRTTAEPAAFAVIRSAVSRALMQCGWAEDLHPVVLLAVGEAAANAIEHGSCAGAQVCVALRAEPGRVCIRVADGGRLGSVVPLVPPVTPPSTQCRGRGLVLMRRLSQGMSIQSSGDGTVVALEFTLRAVRRGAASARQPSSLV